MPDSQSSEPGFESLFATVSKILHFRSLHWCSSWLSCINEYLAIDSGGNVSDLVLARNCCLARMLPGEAELVSEWTGLPGEAKSVKRFERSNRLDTALYKNYLYLFYLYSVMTVQLSQTRWEMSWWLHWPCGYMTSSLLSRITLTGGHSVGFFSGNWTPPHPHKAHNVGLTHTCQPREILPRDKMAASEGGPGVVPWKF